MYQSVLNLYYCLQGSIVTKPVLKFNVLDFVWFLADFEYRRIYPTWPGKHIKQHNTLNAYFVSLMYFCRLHFKDIANFYIQNTSTRNILNFKIKAFWCQVKFQQSYHLLFFIIWLPSNNSCRKLQYLLYGNEKSF